jgi:hypothetical protein
MYVPRIGEMKNAYKILLGKLEGLTPLGRMRDTLWPVVKYISEKYCVNLENWH